MLNNAAAGASRWSSDVLLPIAPNAASIGR
jgi:hypothetical protein